VNNLATDENSGIKIGEIIRQTGVTRATVHHYVREGLLPEPVKLSRNQALYPPNSVDRVLLIKGLQKHQRMSLSEVKRVLKTASDDAALERLSNTLKVETNQARVSLLNPDREGEPLTREQLIERTGLDNEKLRRLEALGLICTHAVGQKRLYSPANIDVADALAGLMMAGFNEDTGFTADDAALYLKAFRGLLHDEIKLFLERVSITDREPGDLLQLAEQGIERVTPLMLALRRKLIREFLEAAPIGKDGS
jgi:DNA-binding transcriptional MerR regulator